MNFVNYPVEENLNKFMYRVYGSMSAGLVVTASVAYYVGMSSLFDMLFHNALFFWLIIFAELGLVIFLSASLSRISYTTATVLFFTYAILNGITLSVIFQIYLHSSIYSTFLITAGMFAGMALYGYVTKSDLTTMGNMAIMLLWGLIFAQIINMFFKSSQAEILFSFVGVIVFCLLTAYDVQKIKALYMQLYGSGQELGKIALLGALSLYLDFINLFLSLLRLTGKRKD